MNSLYLRRDETGNMICYTKEEIDILIQNGEDKNSFQPVTNSNDIERCIELLEEQRIQGEIEMEEQVGEDEEEYMDRLFREELEREQRLLEVQNELRGMNIRGMNITQRTMNKLRKMKKNIFTGHGII